MNFPSHIFNNINHGYRVAILKKNSLWLLLLYITVATYFYYEKVRRTVCTAIVSYITKELFLKNLSQMLSVFGIIATNRLLFFENGFLIYMNSCLPELAYLVHLWNSVLLKCIRPPHFKECCWALTFDWSCATMYKLAVKGYLHYKTIFCNKVALDV